MALIGQGQITIYDVYDGVSGERGQQGVQGVRGEDGTTYYTWVKWADSPTSGMSDTPSNKMYMGIAQNKTSPNESSNYSDYQWVLVKGEDGQRGEQGLRGLQGDKGDQGVRGADGADGKPSYTHIAYANNATGTSGFSLNDSTNRSYIGIYVDSIATDSSDPAKYKWTLIKGAKGDQGVAGQTGADGKTPYFHTAYANSADGSSGFSTTDSNNKVYIGTYTDFNVNDSIDPKVYTWVKIKGETGDRGVQGATGKDGITYYTWVKYADSPTSGMSNDPTNKAYMGIAYNKTSATESTNYSDYKWSLTKGTQGVAGAKGDNGETLYTWVKYATSASGAGMSDSPTGKTYIGLAHNKTTATESNTASDYTWALIKGEKGDTGATGNQGIQGAKGADGQTTYTWVKYADDELGNGMSDEPEGKRYLGLAYNKTVQTESSNKADYSWSPLYDNVDIGGRNLLLATSGEFQTYDNLTGWGDWMHDNTYANGIPVAEGETYTVRGYYKNASSNTKRVSIHVRLYSDTLAYKDFWANWIPVGSEGYSTVTFTIPADYQRLRVNTIRFDNNTSNVNVIEYKEVKLEKGNVPTQWTPALEDMELIIGEIGTQITDLNLATSPEQIINTVVYDEAFTSIMNGKADAEDISDMATGEQLEAKMNEAVQYVDGRLDGEGGIIAGINEVTSALEKTASDISARFGSSGGINLIRNSIGFGEMDFWDYERGSGTTFVQNPELEQLGFGSGFFLPKGTNIRLEQKINITPTKPDGSLQQHSFSYWLNKPNDNASAGWAGVDIVDATGATLAFVGKSSGTGATEGWELGLFTFETPYNEVTIRMTCGSNVDATFSGLMLNVGDVPLQWQHADGEMYNTNIKFNLNGIKVINQETNSQTVISPTEFSGYAEIVNEDTGNTSLERIFTLNGATTEVTEIDVDNEIKMQSVAVRHISNSNNKGWGWIAQE